MTAQAPAEPDMVWMHHYMMPFGYGYMAVATQQDGVNFLQKWDPVRYGSLSQPGDAYAYDIYSQAIEALLHAKGLDPMDGMHLKRVIGIGQSQSATYLNSYVTLAQNDANVLNGIITQADGGTQKSFPNLHIPLIQFETQDSIVSTPPDLKNDPNLYRLWEVVGTDHVGGEKTQDPASVTFVPTDTLRLNSEQTHAAGKLRDPVVTDGASLPARDQSVWGRASAGQRRQPVSLHQWRIDERRHTNKSYRKFSWGMPVCPTMPES